MQFDIENYKGLYVMHCKTQEEAIDFCRYLDGVGRRWAEGERYTHESYFYRYGEHTAYYFNEGMFGHIDDVYDTKYTILEWEDFMSHTFTKADLQTGDVIKRRNGDVEILNRDLGMFIRKDGGWNDFDEVRDDLSNPYQNYDIVAVRRPIIKADCSFYAFENNRGTLVYERQDVEEMTLAQVCKLLGREIKIIK